MILVMKFSVAYCQRSYLKLSLKKGICLRETNVKIQKAELIIFVIYTYSINKSMLKKPWTKSLFTKSWKFKLYLHWKIPHLLMYFKIPSFLKNSDIRYLLCRYLGIGNPITAKSLPIFAKSSILDVWGF